MENLESIAQNYGSMNPAEVNAVEPGNYAPGIFGKLMMYATIMGALALSAVGCSGGNGGSNPPPEPTARITAAPLYGAKPLDAILDASASESGDGSLLVYTIDPGDGSPVIVENAATGTAADGTADGIVSHTYANEGDFMPIVTVRNGSGLEDTAADPAGPVGVGFGADYTGAMDYIDNGFSGMSYDVFRSDNGDYTGFQLLDPSTGFIVPFTADVKGYDSGSGESVYVLWDWDSLTAEQQVCLANRAAEGLVEPKVVVVEEEDSPATIDSLLGL